VTTTIIIAEADLHLQPAEHRPFVDGAGEARAVDHLHQHRRRAQERDQHAEDGDRVRALAAHRLAGQAGDQRAGQRRQRHGEQQVLGDACSSHGAHSAF